MDGMVSVLYRTADIRGTNVTIYECGESPSIGYASDPGSELFIRTFHTDNSKKNVFYQAFASGNKIPFHISKTPPTDEELVFQLEQSGGRIVTAELIMKLLGFVMAGAFLVYMASTFIVFSPVIIAVTIIALLYNRLLKLFNSARKNEGLEQSPHHLSSSDIHPPVFTPASTTASEATESIKSTSPQPIQNRTRCFKTGSGGPIEPHEFGLIAVKMGIGSSQEAVNELIGTAELSGQQLIRSNRSSVQLHLLALTAGAYYVYANKLCASDKQVLIEVAQGLSDGFTALFTDKNGQLLNANNPRSLYELFQSYAGVLAHELDGINTEALATNPCGLGATAKLVIENISGQCGMEFVSANSPLERVMLKKIATTNGIGLLVRLLLGKKIAYSR